MLEIQVTGIKEALRRLNNLANEIPFAASKALNDTAKEVKQEEVREIDRVFDRPTPYVKNSLYVYPSSKTKLVAEVSFKDRQQKIMAPHVYGGTRVMKRSEKLLGEYYVPGQGARLNQYGNMSPGQVTQVLSALKKLSDPYQNTSKRSRSRNKKPRDYFMLRSRRGGLPAGVYEKRSAGRVKPIMIFTKSPSYQKRFPFHKVAENVCRRVFLQKFNAAIDYALRNPR